MPHIPVCRQRSACNSRTTDFLHFWCNPGMRGKVTPAYRMVMFKPLLSFVVVSSSSRIGSALVSKTVVVLKESSFDGQSCSTTQTKKRRRSRVGTDERRWQPRPSRKKTKKKRCDGDRRCAGGARAPTWPVGKRPAMDIAAPQPRGGQEGVGKKTAGGGRGGGEARTPPETTRVCRRGKRPL